MNQSSSITGLGEAELAEARIDFEAYFSDDGKWPSAVERSSDGNYKLMQAASAWLTWQMAVAATRKRMGRPEMEPSHG